MTEPTESTQPPQAPEPAEVPEPAEPAAPASFPEYGAYAPPQPAPEPEPGDPLRGLLAGAGAALLGAIVWAALVYITHYELGIVAVFVGYGVGYVVHRVGRTASVGLAAASAGFAAVGILLGFVLSQLVAGMRDLGTSFLDTVDLVSQRIGWFEFIFKDCVTGVGWLFLAIGAFAAFRLVAQQRRPARRG